MYLDKEGKEMTGRDAEKKTIQNIIKTLQLKQLAYHYYEKAFRK